MEINRYLKGIFWSFAGIIVWLLISFGFSMIFSNYKIISIISFFIISFGWIFGIKIKKEKFERKIDNEPTRQSKFGMTSQNNALLNSKYKPLPIKDIVKGIPVITLFSLIAAYLSNVILLTNFLVKNEKVLFSTALSFSWLGVFQNGIGIYEDLGFVIFCGILSFVLFKKAQKKEEGEEL